MNSAAATCGKCGADVSTGRRMRDSKGRYFCEPCAAALRKRADEKLGPAVGAAAHVRVPLDPGGGRPPETSPPSADDGIFALADEPPRPAGTRAGATEDLPLCPDCGLLLPADRELCTGCGFDRKTGFHAGKRGPAPTGALPASQHVPKPCQKCGYDMTGTKTGRCPECGTMNVGLLKRKKAQTQTLKSMFVGPLIMVGIGVAAALVAYFLRGLMGTPGGVLAGAGQAGWFLLYYALSVAVGFATYIGCSVAFVGFDEPLGVTAVRLAGVYAVTDAVSAVLGLLIPGFVLWPLLAVVYLGLLMQVMELDWEDAWLVGLITYVVHVVVTVVAWYVWLVYF